MTERAKTRVRRRASRAAGPAGAATTGADSTAEHAIRLPAPPSARTARVAGPPMRRAGNARGVGMVAAVVGLLAIVATAAVVAVLVVQHRHAEAAARRDQRFVDTAVQTVVNMYTYTPDTIGERVDQFVAGTSGPLRDTMSASAENLKALLRATNHSSEAVINAAALEGVDEIAGNASVLVAMRATATDIDGVNSPSQPYALRIIVHEDESGNMTAYDLKWPDGSRQ